MARPRSEEAQQRVLGAAVALIAEVGVEGFTVDAVAVRSGVAKTTIYRRWESSDELLLAALEAAIEPLPTPNTGTLRGDLVALYTSVMDMLQQPHMFRTLIGVIARSASNPDFERLKRELEFERHAPMRTMIELAKARGEISADVDIDVATDFIEGPLAARTILRAGSLSAAEIDQMANLVALGLGASAD